MDEFELIARLRERTEKAREGTPLDAAGGRVRVVVGSGDDASVTVPARATATSVDSFVEGVHFRRATASLHSIGRKALAAALSDLAAMGAAPGEAYVQLAIPDGMRADECEELAEGLAAVAVEHHVAILGGDVSRGPALALGLTVVGHADEPDRLVRRAGARPGDVLAVTGELGGAAAGLLLLEDESVASAVSPEIRDALRLRQLEPEPRLAAGQALVAASAMIDVSDGLGGDAAHLAEASGVRIEIELERLPIQAGVAEVARAAGLDVYELAAERGEDYELLAALAPESLEAAREAVEAAGTALTPIGEVSAGEGVVLREPGGLERAPRGFDQLR